MKRKEEEQRNERLLEKECRHGILRNLWAKLWEEREQRCVDTNIKQLLCLTRKQMYSVNTHRCVISKYQFSLLKAETCLGAF